MLSDISSRGTACFTDVGEQCKLEYIVGELRKVHPSFVIELLEEKWKKETLEALEQMSDVVKYGLLFRCVFLAVAEILFMGFFFIFPLSRCTLYPWNTILF